MERFDPDFICNASDDGGRYTYAKQPEICKWNLGKFAEAISAAVPVSETKKIIEDVYDKTFQENYRILMSKKLGLPELKKSNQVQFDELVASLFKTMHETGADFTNTFVVLGNIPYPASTKDFRVEKERALRGLLSQCSTVADLKRSYR